MSSAPARLREATPWLLLGVAAVVLVVHTLAYNFVTDDAYISFVFSRNFAEHGELVFNLGDPVEGYTNFSWTVLLGALMVVGIPPEISSRVLGLACALVTLYLVFRIVERALGRRSPWAAVPPVLLACSSGFACWTSGGLETQLFTMLVTGALEAVVAATDRPRALRRAGALLAFAAMTRPEGVLVAAVLGVIALVHLILVHRATPAPGMNPDASISGPAETRKFPLRDVMIAAAWFLALWAPWFAWRWWYYGWPFPNTYYVKAAGPWADAASGKPQLASQMIDGGLYYIWVWVEQTRLLYALPLVAIGLVTARPRTPRFVLTTACAMLAAIYVPYTISVGGDFMGLHRFIMPLFVIAAIAVVLGIEWLTRFVPEHRRLVVGASVAGALVIGFAITQHALTRTSLRWGNFGNDRGIDTPAFLIVYTEDRAIIGRAMAPCFRPDDFSIVGGAGAQPYFGRMRGIDVFGLVSDRIAHDEPRIRARAGHTKFGSERLLATYDPTFVFSCYRLHRTAAQPQLPCAGFWTARGYEHVTMHIPGLREQGEYYTFLAKKARDFQCPGRVR
ncbi:MAG: hypothetical protein H0T89_23610 [Deltaproteobacteria bacterium]|nr:hypothetical protein [Deltaproteobacteria bacterium]MDQ3297353.1 hypothetical protein [Myxococcota bacterium]